ncbi:MAG: hypothetical protein EPN48_09080 [Microbacteriaceae bacterium]|nr:MAG: hypothetical protein EPN48_09080 [Microbacteriaceae bacterium]
MSNTTPEPPADGPIAEPAEAVGGDIAPGEDAVGEVVAPGETPAESVAEASRPRAQPEDPRPEGSQPEDDEPGAVAPAEAPAPVAATAHAAATATSGLPAEPLAEPLAEPPTEQHAAPPTAAAPTAPHAPTASYITPVYVAAPQPPKNKGNRSAGILIALLAAVVYAIVSAIAVLVIFLLNRRTARIATHDLVQYLGTPSFYLPVVIFALALILLIAIVNRGGWWAYVLGAFVVAVIVYFAYIGSVLLTVNAWQFTPAQVGRIVGQLWANPLTLAAAIIAREVPIWFGAWIAARGKKVRQRNLEATEAYEMELAAGPQPIQRAG